MTRVVSYFDKKDESFVGELELPEVSLSKLQEVFDVPSGNPMYDSCPIGKNQAGFIFDILGVHLDFEKYDYFLECYE